MACALKRGITKGLPSFGSTYADDVLTPHILIVTALYHRLVQGSDCVKIEIESISA
jgi:hypothetical protein